MRHADLDRDLRDQRQQRLEGSLSLLFFGAGTGLIYKYRMYREKPYLYVGLACLIIGATLLIWFAATG